MLGAGATTAGDSLRFIQTSADQPRSTAAAAFARKEAARSRSEQESRDLIVVLMPETPGIDIQVLACMLNVLPLCGATCTIG